MKSHHNGYPEQPGVGFNYAALDPIEVGSDAQSWSLQAELLGNILCWLTESRKLSAVGARVYVLALYLRPELIMQSSLHEISKLPNAPTRACLSKAMIEFQRRYGLKPGRYQKPLWMRERYRRAQLARGDRTIDIQNLGESNKIPEI